MSTYKTISIAELKPGHVLVTPAIGEYRLKLLNTGITVDQHLIDRLRSFGINEVMVEHAAKNKITKRLPKRLPEGPTENPKVDNNNPIRIIDRCGKCGKNIALHPPSLTGAAAIWRCKACGAIYFGSDDGHGESPGLERDESNGIDRFIATAKTEPENDQLLPEYIQRIASSLSSDDHPGAERRRHKRYPIMVPVAALFLARDFRVYGDPVKMTTANISSGGAALIHSRFVDANYLALDFSIAGVDLAPAVLKILRVQSHGVVYEVAGEFNSRLSQTPLFEPGN
jgi:hypothetical protein